MKKSNAVSINERDKRLIKEGHQDSATSKFRPWIRIYQELNSLKAFAITNEMALENILKELDEKFFMSSHDKQLKVQGPTNLLAANIKEIFDQTTLKDT